MARIRELEEGTAPENFQQEQEAQPNDLAAMEAVIDKILGTREKKMNAAHFIDVCERNYDGMSTDSWGDYIRKEKPSSSLKGSRATSGARSRRSTRLRGESWWRRWIWPSQIGGTIPTRQWSTTLSFITASFASTAR